MAGSRKPKARPRTSKKKLTPAFDKYEYYQKSVQSAESDVIFLRKTYRDLRKKDPVTMREDFCGTFSLSCEWVKLSPKFRAIGVDLDPEPLEYGKSHNLTELRPAAGERVRLVQADVLQTELPACDLAIAMNFSYFLFKSRVHMKAYFANVLRSLNPDGVFIMDLFGGSLCADSNEEKTVHKGFTYYWDQDSYDPVTNFAQFYIHFRVHGQPKRERVFSYDWRLWSIPELRELLAEVGFKKTQVYWEGTTKRGGGDGNFTKTETGEPCQSWIAYISAEK